MQRLNPYSEEELLGETTSNLGGEQRTEQQIPPILETSTSSYQQDLVGQHGEEVTSTRPQSKQQSKQGSDIKKAFTEIKARNDPIRIQIYN